jgi:hypothetical protein
MVSEGHRLWKIKIYDMRIERPVLHDMTWNKSAFTRRNRSFCHDLDVTNKLLLLCSRVRKTWAARSAHPLRNIITFEIQWTRVRLFVLAEEYVSETDPSWYCILLPPKLCRLSPRANNTKPSDCRLSAKLVLTFADRGCRVVSVTDPTAVFSVF